MSNRKNKILIKKYFNKLKSKNGDYHRLEDCSNPGRCPLSNENFKAITLRKVLPYKISTCLNRLAFMCDLVDVEWDEDFFGVYCCKSNLEYCNSLLDKCYEISKSVNEIDIE